VNSSNLVKTREGTTELMVPQGFCTRGPGKSSGDVFYNGQMEFSRDISVLLGRVILKNDGRALDGLAASGARGLRMAGECGSDWHFTLNDRNERAAQLIRKNSELNGLSNVDVSCRDLRALLAEEHFNYIDIDPFGTPVPFIDAAVQGIGDDGIVAVTATDTAPLSGTYPKTCVRRYGALSARSPFSHETGLRILMGYIVREAAKHDRGCEPLLCFHADHYFRCHMKVRRGAGKADKSLAHMGFATYDRNTLRREVTPERPTGDIGSMAGPLWCGELHSSDVLNQIDLDSTLGTHRRCEKMIGLWRGELSAAPLYYRVDELARHTKSHPPKSVRLIEGLRENGASASPTHFDPKGIKTDMPLDELLVVFKAVSER
jgi:tRNA (guanine26-N2/guanine27-N2)-dimethyltransferase